MVSGRYFWLQSHARPTPANAAAKTRVSISANGPESACSENSDAILTELNISHLSHQTGAGVWFASGAAGIKVRRGLNGDYRVPASVMTVALNNTIPRGVMVRLALLEPISADETDVGWRDEWFKEEERKFSRNHAYSESNRTQTCNRSNVRRFWKAKIRI